MNTHQWTYACELKPGDCLSDGTRVVQIKPVNESVMVTTDNQGDTAAYRRDTTLRVWRVPPTAVDLEAARQEGKTW